LALALLASLWRPASAAEVDDPNAAIRQWEGLGYGMYIHHHLVKILRDETSGARDSIAQAPWQWARVARESGMKFAVLVAKHEDGFCLWDSKDYDFDVGTMSSPPALLDNFIAACQKEKLLPGIHYSVGDRYNESGDFFKPPVSRLYFEFVLKQTRELHTAYPQIGFHLFDLAHRFNPAQRRQLYDEIQRLNPKCMVLAGRYVDFAKSAWIHRGPDPGLESDAYLPRVVIASVLGDKWAWSSDAPMVSAERLLGLYEDSAKNAANFLLNVGPDESGQIPPDQCEVLAQLGKLIARSKVRPATTFLASDYHVFAPGAVWEFVAEVTSPGPSRNKTVQTGKEFVRCTGKEIIGGKEYHRYAVLMAGFPDQPDRVVYFRKNDQGLFTIEGKQDQPERVYLPQRLVLGKRWEERIGAILFSSWIDGVETVDGLKQTYRDCLKLRMDVKDAQGKILNEGTIYLAKGVGAVKALFESGGISLKLSLENFVPK
jgi:alpha-L-fucosidase